MVVFTLEILFAMKMYLRESLVSVLILVSALTLSRTLASQTRDEDFGPNMNIASLIRDQILGSNMNIASFIFIR